MFSTTNRGCKRTRALSVALVSILIWPEGILSNLEAARQTQTQTSQTQTPTSQTQTPAGLRVVVLKGDKVQNNIEQRVEQNLTVRVQEVAGGPIAGADVVFTAPASGAGGFFSNGARTGTATTDNQGIAVSDAFRPNDVLGDFQIEVEASYLGQKSSTPIMQSNVKKGGSAKWILILGAIGGAVAGIAAAAGKKGSNTQPPPPPPVIQPVPGTPTVGSPPP